MARIPTSRNWIGIVIVVGVIAALLCLLLVGLRARQEGDSPTGAPASSESSAPMDDSAMPTSNPTEDYNSFEQQVISFVQAWHTEDSDKRLAALKPLSTEDFRKANQYGDISSTVTTHVIGLDSPSGRPVISYESADEADTGRFVYVSGVHIEKRDSEGTVIAVFEAPPLETAWVKRDGKWLINSQTYPLTSN